MPSERLRRGVAPRAVAIYGASAKQQGAAGGLATKVAGRLIENGYRDRLALINPRQQSVLGLETQPSATASPLCGTLDLAVIAVPSGAVVNAVEDCIAAGIAVGTILSSGFAEMSEQGATIESDLDRVAQGGGFRFFGPNCLGLINFSEGIFASTQHVANAKPGPITIIAQSGSVATTFLEVTADLDVGCDLWITIGNASSIDAADCIQLAVSRPTTKTVLLYLESLGRIEPFRRAVMAARAAGKDVVLLKSGRSCTGARTMASHTAAIASSDDFVDVLVRECGAIRVNSIREGGLTAALISKCGGSIHGRAAIVTASGGDAVLAADACDQAGIELARLEPATTATVKRLVPQSGVVNPVDPTPVALSTGCLDRVVGAVAGDPNVDYLIYLAGDGIKLEPIELAVSEALMPLAQELPVLVDGRLSETLRSRFLGAGIMVTDDRERLWRALRNLLGELPTVPTAQEPQQRRARARASQLMPERDAFEELTRAGLPMVPLVPVEDEDDVHTFGRTQGFPIVLKGLVPQLSHKSDLDLVRLDLLDDAAAASAFRSLAKDVSSFDEGIVVAQRQIRFSLAEVIVGAINDDDFGTHVVVGRGGIWAEATPDRAWAHGVLDIDEAERLLTRFRFGAALVADKRGLQLDVRGLAEVIARLSAWAQSHAASVREVEVNPVIVAKEGASCVDCLIAMR